MTNDWFSKRRRTNLLKIRRILNQQLGIQRKTKQRNASLSLLDPVATSKHSVATNSNDVAPLTSSSRKLSRIPAANFTQTTAFQESRAKTRFDWFCHRPVASSPNQLTRHPADRKFEILKPPPAAAACGGAPPHRAHERVRRARWSRTRGERLSTASAQGAHNVAQRSRWKRSAMRRRARSLVAASRALLPTLVPPFSAAVASLISRWSRVPRACWPRRRATHAACCCARCAPTARRCARHRAPPCEIFRGGGRRPAPLRQCSGDVVTASLNSSMFWFGPVPGSP
ncbi:hypothetical protein F511_31312 [Dorcoceras hygrometricum]|uniref:Uncharacterized protein n=1 Tax=Dorcoceras hygrometricum TaxID=472368 RepID=A0A2Z7A8V3_9LAMI|nr:hypothetical protein F511_31312 [Dorcoceras hygrometricum]